MTHWAPGVLVAALSQMISLAVHGHMMLSNMWGN